LTADYRDHLPVGVDRELARREDDERESGREAQRGKQGDAEARPSGIEVA
jgi:hypothetical protein